MAVQPATSPPQISPALLDIMQRGVSVIVASCGRDGVPNVMRGVGCRVSEDGSDITVYLSRGQSRQLLQDIADTSRVAVVFSSPTSHLTVQVKSSNARVEILDEGAAEDLDRYLRSMEEEIAGVGFEPRFTRAMLAHDPDDLVALRLVPEQAFDQTPGPRAGALLPARTA